MTEKHLHNGTDSPKLDAKRALLKAPQSALTVASGSLSSGGMGTLSSADSAVLTNAILRISELETKLRNLGLLR